MPIPSLSNDDAAKPLTTFMRFITPDQVQPLLTQKLLLVTPTHAAASIHPQTQNKDHADINEEDKVCWGKHFRNLTSRRNEEGVYWFDDTYKQVRRLNILGHCSVDDKGKGTMSIEFAGKATKIDGAVLKYIYDFYYKKESLSAYRYIRVIGCHSANGTDPLGQQVANAFGLETKAFGGIVESIRPEAFLQRKINRNFISEDGSRIDWNEAFVTKKRGLVSKTMPIHPKIKQRWTGYNPVKFLPQVKP